MDLRAMATNTEDGSKKTEAGRQGDAPFLLIAAALFLLIIGALTAAALSRNGIYRSHVTLWAEVVKRSPDKRRAHENYGQAFSTAGMLDEALKEFQTVLALPDDGSVPLRDLYRELGVVQSRMGLYDDALLSWQKGLRFAPDDSGLLVNLSTVLMRNGRYEEAAAHARLALALDPFLPQALNTMGQVHLHRKEYEQAFTYFVRAIEQAPDVPAQYWNAALAMERSGKYAISLRYAARFAAMEGDADMRQQAYQFMEYLNKKLGG